MSPYLPGSPPTAPLAPVAAYLPATDSHNLTQYGEITAYDDSFYGHDQCSTTQVDDLEWNYTELRYHEHYAPSLDMTLSSDSLLCVAGHAYGEAGVMYDQFPHGSTSWDTGATNVDGRMPILAGAPMDHQTPWGSSTTWCYCATCRNFEETSIHPSVGVPNYHYYSADQNNYVDSEPPTPPPAGSELRIPPICRWEGCNVLLDDSSPSGVKRHLYDCHDITRADCASGARGHCKWEIDGAERCGRALDLSSFAKHVASVHLKSTQRRCEDCRCMIGRADSLTRHQRDHCAARRDWQLEGWV
ncbi:uncharacterized protein B0H18DRAFT_1118775 [Fomitopsis serialis]|uniref:uncharacterized protein n=1 Tax=Fomitopsis serialis TaxID=139415 RepID=UPI0020083646|nr:uncharacterized protein B0H18DRAFT_1118775 [Neoantrodia serialis]KAH9926698.1 hypothetical protein B0H18DRAFT_1118775 [Neoantrodia serialis]